MVSIDDYTQEKECEYKGERYKVRDNGAVLRFPQEGKKARKNDNIWTFGTSIEKGYRLIAGHRVHIIVATAFHGSKDSSVYVVDHIDTNRANNRPENLRWLTKLENILLNDITRSKIEYLCGSIENFLENPSLLCGHEMDDVNFSWMRAVSKEEAANTLKNWKKLMDTPRSNPTIGINGEWMYKSLSTPNVSPLLESKSLQGSLYEKMKMEDEQKKKEKEEKRKERRQQLLKREEEKKKLEDNMIVLAKDAIISFAESVGAQIEYDVKYDLSKTEIFLSFKDRKFTFSLSTKTMNQEEFLESYKQKGIQVSCYGGKQDYRSAPLISYPFFPMEIKRKSLYVMLSYTNSISIDFFLEAVINGKLIQSPNIQVKAIKVRFIGEDCYKCGNLHYMYFVNGLITKDDSRIITYEEMYNENIEIDEFDPVVVTSIKRYLSMHKELKYPMGDIKKRFSNTRGESYISFGCPYCDAIVGDHYFMENKIDYIYEPDDNNVHVIELIKPIEIPAMNNPWIIEN